MYRNIVSYVRSGVQFVWEATWDEQGNRVEIETPIEPYLYYEDRKVKDDKYKSLFGKPLRKMSFKTDWERKEWIERSPNIPLFEKMSPTRQYLLDKYFGLESAPEFSQYPFRIFNIDIEVEVNGEFPDPYKANYPINVISIFNTLQNEIIVWCYKSNALNLMTNKNQQKIINEINKDYKHNAKIIIKPFENEILLLKDFINYWTSFFPDIVTGWNTKGYDIPYIINRISSQLGESEINKLSPIFAKKAVYSKYDKRNDMIEYFIQGISLLDYLPLYKKFAGSSKQSFKLDYIAKEELNVGKFDYYDIGYESIEEFMKKDFVTFVQYNIIDTILVRLLDKKLGFITLTRNICNLALTEYDSIYMSIPHILGVLTIQARQNNLKFLTDSNKDKNLQKQTEENNEGFTGAFVFPTIPGYYNKGIMSFDFNSLYPNVMMTVNISPDTKVGKILTQDLKADKLSVRKANGVVVQISQQQFQKLVKQKCTLSANNVLYIKPSIKFGIIPQFLDRMYNQRVKVKTQMKANKKKAKLIGDQIQKLKKQLQKIK